MSNTVSTITSKWQVTIPEEVRKGLPFQIGQRIAWEVDGDKLVGRRIRSMAELAGCLKASSSTVKGNGPTKAFGQASLARHERLSRQKP